MIHDFFVPAFRTKADVLPGRYTTIWFKPTKPGKYHLFCSQYCGTNHYAMIGWVYVMEPQDYQAWLSGGTTGSLASSGEKLFQDSRLRELSSPNRRAGTGPESTKPLRQAQVELTDGCACQIRRGLHSGVDLESFGEDRDGLSAHHADIPGTDH